MALRRLLRSPWAVPEAIPVVAVAGSGTVFAGYMMYTRMAHHNDVTVNKSHKLQYWDTPQQARLATVENSKAFYESHGVDMPKDKLVKGTV